ncbi:MAG: hypothetical protein ABJA82_01255 [Myxococcales bacterium]
MHRAYIAVLLGFLVLGCSSSSQTPDAATPGSGGVGGAGATGSGGSNAVASTPVFTRDDCGKIAASDLKPGTSQAAPTMFVPGQLVGGRVDPASLSNLEHHWAIQLAPGFYHLVVDAMTADGESTNLGIKVTQVLASGEEELMSGNEIARHYRDQTFFEIKTSAVVSLKVISMFKMEDYLMGVFANGTPVPSPAFSHCPSVTPLAVGVPASFTLGASGTAANEEQWFLVDLNVGNYKFMLDATQADGADTNLIYYVEALDRFGQQPRVKEIVFENEIGKHFTAQGTLAISDTGSYWVRLRNGNKDLNVTMTVSAQ